MEPENFTKKKSVQTLLTSPKKIKFENLDLTDFKKKYNHSNFSLQTIIKENHGQQIQDVTFIPNEKCPNIVGTIGGNQLNLYDNFHLGNNLDILMHFKNEENPHIKIENRDTTLTAFCFSREYVKIQTENRLVDDVYLILGEKTGLIQVISMKRSQVITLLNNHKSLITSLAIHPSKFDLLFSGSEDKTICIWNINSPSPLISQIKLQVTPFCLEIAPDFHRIFVGTTCGEIKIFDLDEKKFSLRELNSFEKKKSSNCIDSIKFPTLQTVITKSKTGRITLWDSNTGQIFKEMIVPNCHEASSKMGVSQDGELFCVGNSAGEIFLYHTESLTLLCRLEHKRSKNLVRSVAISHDNRSIIYVTNDFVWKYQYAKNENKENRPENTSQKI